MPCDLAPKVPLGKHQADWAGPPCLQVAVPRTCAQEPDPIALWLCAKGVPVQASGCSCSRSPSTVPADVSAGASCAQALDPTALLESALVQALG